MLDNSLKEMGDQKSILWRDHPFFSNGGRGVLHFFLLLFFFQFNIRNIFLKDLSFHGDNFFDEDGFYATLLDLHRQKKSPRNDGNAGNRNGIFKEPAIASLKINRNKETTAIPAIAPANASRAASDIRERKMN
jgi:hypothetical protein